MKQSSVIAILWSPQDCLVVSGIVAQQVIDCLKECESSGSENQYKVDQVLYLKVREKIEFFQERQMLVSFFVNNYEKKVIIEELFTISVAHFEEMMQLVQKINDEINDERP